MENDLGEFASSSCGPYGYGMVWYGGTVVVGFGFAALLIGRFCNLVVVSKMFLFSMMHSWSQHLTHYFKISDVSVHGYFGCRGWFTRKKW